MRNMKPKEYKKPCVKFFKTLVCLILIQLFLSPTLIRADSLTSSQINQRTSNHIFSEQIKALGEIMSEYMDEDVQEIFPEFNMEHLIEHMTDGNTEGFIKKIISWLINLMVGEVLANISLMVKLLVVAIICALLNNLQISFDNKGASEIAFFVCYMAMIAIIMLSIQSVIHSISATVNNMTGFMYATIPILIVMLVSGGNMVSSGIFQPILVISVQIVGTVLRTIIIPMVFFSTVLLIIDNIIEKEQITRLAKLIRQVCVWLMGGIMGIFVTIVMAQGFVGGISDGIALKTAKFALGSLIPVAGGYLSDAAEAVLGSFLVIKNSIGIVILIGIILISLIPILKLAAIILIYKLTCAVIQPISDKRIVTCMDNVAASFSCLLGILSAVTFMFVLSVVTVIGVMNTTWNL